MSKNSKNKNLSDINPKTIKKKEKALQKQIKKDAELEFLEQHLKNFEQMKKYVDNSLSFQINYMKQSGSLGYAKDLEQRKEDMQAEFAEIEKYLENRKNKLSKDKDMVL